MLLNALGVSFRIHGRIVAIVKIPDCRNSCSCCSVSFDGQHVSSFGRPAV